jgi:penicillin-binding protein 1C
MARLYAMLANGGQLKPLVTSVGEQPARARALLSPEAAWITLDMLQANPRPDTGQRAFPPVAWKTGTSWGFRDAWTAGVFGRLVLVVWVGNFDGSANPAFVGVQTAAPLFFQIVDSLRSQGLASPAPDPTGPLNLSRVSVCKASGDLPNEHCSDLSPTWFIPGKSPIKVSTLHRVLWVQAATGRAVCGPGPGVQREVFEHWGSDMLQLFAQAGMPRRVPPAAPRCGGNNSGAVAGVAEDGPQIVSPLRGANYVLRINRQAAEPAPTPPRRAGVLVLPRPSQGARRLDLSWLPQQRRYDCRGMRQATRARLRSNSRLDLGASTAPQTRRFTAARMPRRISMGGGGQPGTLTSTGITCDTAPQLA